LDANVEDDCYVPGFEFRALGTDALAAPADNVETDADEEGEDCVRIGLEIDSYVLC
jgi:hypothetical protein